jgi:2'-5' RNA ligase
VTPDDELQTGLFIGFMVPEDVAIRLAIAGGEPDEDLHITLAYLGDLTELLPNAGAIAVDVARGFASANGSLECTIAGFGKFDPVPDRPTTVLWANPNVPGIQRFRAGLVAALSNAGLELTGLGTVGPYVPHITLAYVEPGQIVSPPDLSGLPSFSLDELTVGVGDHRICFPLEGANEPDVRLTAEIRKIDESRGLVFGWANVAVTKSGKQIVDLHGDEIDVEDLERAAYDFMLHFTDVGMNDLHDGPLVAKPVESMVFTDEKFAAMATDPATGKVDAEALAALKKYVPQGWWTGWQLDPASEQFAMVRDGTRPMMSIEGWATKETAA